MRKFLLTLAIVLVFALSLTMFVACVEITPLQEKPSNIPSACPHVYANECDTTCEICGAERSVKHSPVAMGEAIEPTCDTAGLTAGSKCSLCGVVLEAQQAIAALGHKENVILGKAPTCKEAGLTEGKQCSVCGEITVPQVEIAKLAHTEVVDAAVAPTCTETGLTEGKHCSVCGDVTLAQQVVDVLGHTEVTIDGKSPTCTETGLTDGIKCDVCEQILTAQEVIKALGHNEGEWIIDTPATCVTEGSKHTECTVCHNTVSTAIIEATGHTFDETQWKFDNDNHWHKCANCDVTSGLAEHSLDNEGKCTICPFGCEHSGTPIVIPEIPATCEQDGKTAGTQCPDCGLITGCEKIPAIGHDYEAVFAWNEGSATILLTCKNNANHKIDNLTVNVTSVTTDASCLVDGKIVYTGTVTYNNVTYTGANEVVITATGHTWSQDWTGDATGHWRVCSVSGCDGKSEVIAHTSVVDEAVVPTCTATGLTAGSHCADCNFVIEKQQEVAIDKDNHPTDSIVVVEGIDATCGRPGLTDGSKCRDCDATLVEQELVNATGQHKDDNSDNLCEVCHLHVLSQTVITPTEATEYRITLYQATNDKTLYINGAMSDNYLATTEELAQSLIVFVEVVDGGYKFYANIDGAKKYIDILNGIKYVDSSNCVFSYEVERNIWKATSGTKTVYIGTYNNFNTLSSSQEKYITAENSGTTQFPAVLVAINCEHTYTAGCDATCNVCNHVRTVSEDAAHIEKVVSGKEPTCTETGLTEGKVCESCGTVLVEQEVIPVAHKDVNNDYLCDGCGKAITVTLTFDNKANRTEYDAKSHQTWIENGATFINTKSTSTSDIYDASDVLRCYKGSTLTLELEDIKKVVIIVSASKYAVNITVNGAKVTVDTTALTITIEFDVPVSSFTTDALSAQVRIDSIEITREKIAEHVCDGDVVVEEVSATCATDGYTAGTKCSVCGEIQSGCEVIHATGHNVPQDAEWESDNYSHWHACLNEGCEDNVDKADHDKVEFDGIPATCIQAGMNPGEKCTICGKVTKEPSEQAALGHVDANGDGKCDRDGCDADVDANATSNAILDFTAQKYSNQQKVPSLTADGVTVTLNKGEGSSDPAFYTTGNAVRVYAKGLFTVTAPEGKYIVQITITFGSGDKSNTITVDSGIFANNVWSGSANSVTFTVGGTKDHRRIAKIEVLYNSTGVYEPEAPHECTYGDPTWVWADDFSKATATFTCTDANCTAETKTIDVVASGDAITYKDVLSCSSGTRTYTAVIAFGDKDYTNSKDKALSAGDGHKYNILVRWMWTEQEDGSYTASIVLQCANDETHVATFTADVTYAVENEPTCTAVGKGVYTAKYNSFLDTKDIELAKLNHTEEVVKGTPTTCTTAGLTDGKKCSVCGAITVQQTEIEALGHNLVSHEGKGATCTEAGYKPYNTCTRCDFSTYEVIEALGHTEEELKAVAPTCTTPGLTDGKKCSVCGTIIKAQETVDATGHKYFGYGYDETHHYSICGNFLNGVDGDRCCHIDETTKVEHKFVYTSNGEGTHKVTCECETCDFTLASVDCQAVVDDAVAPTCTTTGLTEGSHCGVCKAVLVAQETVKELGHKEEVIQGTDATCTESGLTDGKKCSVCGETLAEQTVIEALGHEYGELVARVDATCVATGFDAHYFCDVCDTYFTADKVATTSDALTLPIVADAHDFATGWTTDTTYHWHVCKNEGCEVVDGKAEHVLTDGTNCDCGYGCDHESGTATCENKAVCTKCNNEYGDLDPNNHVWEEEFTQDLAPTCTAVGSKSKHCSNIECDAKTEITEVPTLGHDEVSHDAQAPTCEGIGWDAYVTCSRCEYTTYVEKAATGHNYTNGQFVWADDYSVATYVLTCANDESHKDEHKAEVTSVTTPATCADKGSIVYTATYGELNDTKTVEIAIVATAHPKDKLETLTAVDATCTSTGLTEGQKCTHCGTIIKEQETVDALGHTEVEIPAVDATCTTDGSTAGVKCSVCQEVLTAPVEIPASHTEGEWVVDNEATCIATGSRHQVCSVCGDTLATETIPMVEHNYGELKETPATCTATGLASHYQCSECEGYFTAEKVATTLESLTVGINVDNHTSSEFVYVSNSDGTHDKTYKCCGAVVIDNESCSGGEATCIAKAVCEHCDMEYGALAEHTTSDGICDNCGCRIETKNEILKDQIAVGDTVILTNSEKKQQLGEINTYGALVPYATDAPSIDTMLITVEEGTIEGTFALKTDSGYLSWKSSNSLNVESTRSKNSSWYITIDSNGNATIANATDQTRTIRYNSGSRFATYGANSSVKGTIQLYKYEKVSVSKCVDNTCVYDSYVVEEDGHYQVCTVCGFASEKNAHDTNVADDGDCTSAIKCSCGYVLTAAYDSHDIVVGSSTETGHSVSCQREGCNFTETATHEYSEETTTYPKDAATCTTNATYYHTCVCGERGDTSYTKADTMLAHELEDVTGTPATDTVDGLTDGQSCKNCDYTTQTVILSQKSIMDKLYAGETLEGTYTLTGAVVSIDTAYSAQYDNVTITMSVNGSEYTLTAYRLTGTGADVIRVGDTITVTGTFGVYNGAPQFASGCTIVSFNNDANVVKDAKAELALGTDFTNGTTSLPTSVDGFDGVSVSWNVETNNYVSITDNVMTVANAPTTAEKITLVATITKGNASETREFPINVVGVVETFNVSLETSDVTMGDIVGPEGVDLTAVNKGTILTIKANAVVGYELASYSINGGDTVTDVKGANSFDVTVTEDMIITATFAKKIYTETIVFVDAGYEDKTTLTSITLGAVNLTLTKGTANPTYYASDGTLRVYASGGVLSFAISTGSEGFVIKNIKLVTASGTLSGDGYNSSTKEWSGQSESVKLTVESNVKIESITITYSLSCEHANKTAAGEAKAATCTEDGITAGEKCVDCGVIITAQETIPANGHNYVDGICSVCGENESTGGGETPAEPVTTKFTASDNYSTNTTLDKTNIAIDEKISMVFTAGGTATQYYTSGYAIRWYGGGTLTVSAIEGYEITEIVITYGGTKKNEVTADVGSFTDASANKSATWTGTAQSVKFTQAGTSGQDRIVSVEVTYSPVA